MNKSPGLKPTPFRRGTSKEIVRSTAIIITLPVAFLTDLGKTVYDTLLLSDKEKEDYGDYGIPGIAPTKKGLIVEGFKRCIKEIEYCVSNPDEVWYHSMNNKPVNSNEILYCYVNVLNKIRYRFKVIGFNPGGEIKFNDGRKWWAKNWLLMHQPEKIKEIKMGGFQGFRYWKENYED